MNEGIDHPKKRTLHSYEYVLMVMGLAGTVELDAMKPPRIIRIYGRLSQW